MKAIDLPTYYNVIDILEHNLVERGQKEALFSAERTMTFQEVADQANQVGNALLRLGVRSGDIVGILAPDSSEWVTSFFGIVKIGAISLGMNALLEEAQYEYILRDSRARTLIVHESLLSKVEAIRDAHETLAHVIVIGEPQRSTDIAFDTWIAQESTTLDAVQTHRDDFCTLNYSSGTTGQPKGIFHAHKDYPLLAQNYGVDVLKLQESDRAFSVSKFFFVYGICSNLIGSWYVGAGMVVYSGSPRMVHGVLETITSFQPTLLYNVPTGYSSMLAVTNLTESYDLSSIRMCVSAGEPLPASTWERWREQTGLEIYEHIGCTETLGAFLANHPGKVRAGSSGTPCVAYEAKLVDDDGQPVPQGEIGTLLVKGETVALFYLHQYEKSRQTFLGEWYWTGDKYRVDADGFYWHMGRADELFKVGGNWVSPTEIEEVISSHPDVRECAVIGQLDNGALMRPKAFVCLNDSTEHEHPEKTVLPDLLRLCTKGLTSYKRPRWIEFIDTLPRTATGKVQRFKLKQDS
ncbi:MAG: benzoate-CoA ligase family protein [Chloroflexota bacterium]